jgi:hypothetical protein
VRDLELPEGVESLMDEDRTVCSVTPPSGTADAVAAPEAAAGGEPEVIKKAKGDA